MKAVDTIDTDQILSEIAPQTNKDIPIEDIIELRKKKLSIRQIAKILDCSFQNIAQRLQDTGLEQLEGHKKHRADIIALKSAEILSSIDQDTIKKASLLQRLSGYGILYDKERLELDKATSIVKPLVSFGTEPIDVTPVETPED